VCPSFVLRTNRREESESGWPGLEAPGAIEPDCHSFRTHFGLLSTPASCDNGEGVRRRGRRATPKTRRPPQSGAQVMSASTSPNAVRRRSSHRFGPPPSSGGVGGRSASLVPPSGAGSNGRADLGPGQPAPGAAKGVHPQPNAIPKNSRGGGRRLLHCPTPPDEPRRGPRRRRGPLRPSPMPARPCTPRGCTAGLAGRD
jgi:hypothetical protein